MVLSLVWSNNDIVMSFQLTQFIVGTSILFIVTHVIAKLMKFINTLNFFYTYAHLKCREFSMHCWRATFIVSMSIHTHSHTQSILVTWAIHTATRSDSIYMHMLHYTWDCISAKQLRLATRQLRDKKTYP